MDKLSKIRRYMVSNPEVLVLSEQGMDFAVNVFYGRSNRRRLAELLCAALSDALRCPFGLGTGRDWFAQGGELMGETLDSFLNASLLTDEERQRGRESVQRPHTPASMLELLAATEKAIGKRRDAEALARRAAGPPLQVAA